MTAPHADGHDRTPSAAAGPTPSNPDTSRAPSESAAAVELLTAWSLLSEATLAVRARLTDSLAAAGELTTAEFNVLLRLRREPTRKLPLAWIAHRAGLTASGFTKLVDRMETNRLIVTENGTDDRRARLARLTDHGYQLTAVAFARYHDALTRHLLEPLGAEGLQALTALSRTLRDHESTSTPNG